MIRYIFSINTGRSGSAYLQTLFTHVEHCHAFHEPEPIGNGRVMREFLRGNSRPMERLAAEKARRIEGIVGSEGRYVETNHCFLKGYGWFLPRLLSEEQMGVVILKRDRARVVDSMIRTDSSPIVPTGRDWIMTPLVSDPQVRPPRGVWGTWLTYQMMRIARLPFRGERYWASLGLKKPRVPPFVEGYERSCIEWYVQEMEARTKTYLQRFSHLRYYEADVDELNDLDSVRRLFRFFGWEAKPSLSEAVGKRVNLKATMSR